MDCGRVEARLAAHALGKAALSARVAAHLETCDRCRGELDRLKSVLSVVDRELESSLSVDVPPSLTALIRQRLSTDQPEPRAGWLLRWAVVGVMGIAAILVVVERADPPQVTVEDFDPLDPSLPGTGAAPNRESSPTPSMVGPSTPSSATAFRESPPSGKFRMPEPKVLVPPGQDVAILAFHGRSNAGQIAVSSPGPRSALVELPEPPELTIPAIRISPLVLADVRIVPLALPIDPPQRK